jgi:hypothetical protein
LKIINHLVTAPNGGYRVMAAASGRHVARLLFQRASVLIADLVRAEGRGASGLQGRRTSRYA